VPSKIPRWFMLDVAGIAGLSGASGHFGDLP
jgi:hypothetical protein